MRARDSILRQIQTLKRLGIRPPKKIIGKQREPIGLVLSYTKVFDRILELAKSLIKARLLPRLESWERSAGTFKRDAWSDEVNGLLDDLSSEFFDEFPNNRLASLATEHANAVSDYQKAEFARQVRTALGVDVLSSEPWLEPKVKEFAAENVALIKSMAKDYFSDAEKVVARSIREGVRPTEIAAELEDRFGVSESKASLIARDQTNKLFGDLNEERQREAGVDKFVWRTSNDERVRESHAELEGEVFSWDDLPTVDGEPDVSPGFQINCRCVADPVLEDLAQ